MLQRDRGSRRTLWLLLIATLACYGTGYPLALWGHSNAGWMLVFLGGPLLLTVGVLTVRLLHETSGARTPADHSPVPGSSGPGRAAGDGR